MRFLSFLRAAGAAVVAIGLLLAVAPPAAASTTDPAGAPRVGYTASTAVAGNDLSFAGRGFEPGEQVVATLDDGAAAVGPLTAGAGGEVAGVLSLPSTLRPGTHVLIVSGAASDRVAQTEIEVQAGSGAAAVEGSTSGGLVPTVAPADAPAWVYLALMLGILVAVIGLVIGLVVVLARAGSRRRARRAVSAGVGSIVAGQPRGGSDGAATSAT